MRECIPPSEPPATTGRCTDLARVPLIDPPYDVGVNHWNITRSVANSPACFDAFTRFVGLMGKNRDLTPCEKEVTILRVGALTGSQYEWRRHIHMGRNAGLTDDEIAGIKHGDATTLSRRTSGDAGGRGGRACDHD